MCAEYIAARAQRQRGRVCGAENRGGGAKPEYIPLLLILLQTSSLTVSSESKVKAVILLYKPKYTYTYYNYYIYIVRWWLGVGV